MVLIRLLAAALAAASIGLAHANEAIVERFGRMPETWDAEISPTGDKLALGCAPTGVRAVCIYTLDSDEKPRLFATPDDARIDYFYWASPDHVIVVINFFERLSTSSGLKDYRIRRAISFNTANGKTASLMDGQQVYDDMSHVDALLPSKDDKVLVAFRGLSDGSAVTGSRVGRVSDDRDEFEVDLNSGRAKKLRDKSRYDGYGYYDADGELIAVVEYDGVDTDYRIRRVKGGNALVFEEKQAAKRPFGILSPTENGDGLIIIDRDSDDWGIKRLVLADGSIEDIEIAGEPIGMNSPIVDNWTNAVLGFNYTDDIAKQVFINPEFAAIQSRLEKASGKTVRILSWSLDRSILTLSLSAPGTPSAYFMYDTSTGQASPIGAEAPWLDGVQLGTVSSLTYEARDGLEIEAYLTLPPGKTADDGPFPLLLLPHGGPEAFDTAEYDWLPQSFAAAGYAVLQPNFRGSDGYGGEFRNAGFGEFGGLMVTDTLDGATHLKSEGIADGRVCVMGASYGGYAALMAPLAAADTDHELTSSIGCLISINGVTKPYSMLGDLKEDGGFFLLGMRYLERYLGEGVFGDDAEKARVTPVDRVREYALPVLMIHGKEDTVVPFKYFMAMKRAAEGMSNFTFVEMKDEDHYLGSNSARETVLRESLAFLATHHPVN